MLNVSSWRGGLGGGRARPGWRCGLELCWRQPMVSRIPTWPADWVCRARRVKRWRNRFVEHRCDGLLDEPRPGRPRTVGDAQIEALITATLETTPSDATHWSTRSMAKHLGLTQSTVSRVWRAFGLAPHKQDSWKLSKDPLFVAKVRDVVGLYLNPPERALVLCVDEKTQIQALNRTQP